MQGQTLIKLFKNGKELLPLLAIGPIIRPYRGEPVDNEVVLDFRTIPKELRYVGTGHLTVKVKTPEKEFIHKIHLVPENIYDEWKVEIQDEPTLNEALLKILCSLHSYLSDYEFKSILSDFCTFLLPKTEGFNKALEKLSEIAVKRPIWFLNLIKYEPLENEEVYFFSTYHWIATSNPNYTEETLIAIPNKRLELAPMKNLEPLYFQELWKHLDKGFSALLILTPEIFTFEFKVFGFQYLEIWKDFETRETHKKLLADTPIVKALLKGLMEEIPYDYIKVASFDNELIDQNFNEFLSILKSLAD
jgi:hypothetical protein